MEDLNLSQYQELFLSESREILTVLNKQLVVLEKKPDDLKSLNEVFRQMHTLKGMAASMGYEELSSLCHAAEGLLDKIRQKEMEASGEVINLLFEVVDAVEFLIDELAKSGKALQGRRKLDAQQVRVSVVKTKLEKWRDMKEAAGPKTLPENLETNEEGQIKQEMQTVRIRLDHLDALMDAVGELVIHKSRLANLSRALENKSLEEVLAQVGRITDELQNRVMQVRLIPLETIFNRFPRVVRDLAQEEKKEVDLVLSGQEIGLDRTLLDEIHEPLIHLIRNAVSHGIEPAAVRKKLGKKERGTIGLAARRERHYVVIEVSDDGCGIDVEVIKKIALERKIVKPEDLVSLKAEEILMLITSPGFSTQREVTAISGRGVGMNSVRTRIESFGGTLRIESRPGEGSRFVIQLPLSLAIVQALLVRMDSETYAIPLANVSETIKIDSEQIRTLENGEMISWRENVLPLIRLKEKLGSKTSRGVSGVVPVVIVETGAHKKVGLIVDAFLGQQEVVIKTLREPLKNIKGIAGATILGDGRVAMIADINAIV